MPGYLILEPHIPHYMLYVLIVCTSCVQGDVHIFNKVLLIQKKKKKKGLAPKQASRDYYYLFLSLWSGFFLGLLVYIPCLLFSFSLALF